MGESDDAATECDAQLADPAHTFPETQQGIPEHARVERAEDPCGVCAARNRSVVSQTAAERMTIQSSTAWSAHVRARGRYSWLLDPPGARCQS
jgi:hypothetical protein